MNEYLMVGYICGVFITAFGLSRLASNGPKRPWQSFSEFWNCPGAVISLLGLGVVFVGAIIAILTMPH